MNLKKGLMVLAVAMLLSFGLYGNSLGGEFVFDDEYMVVRPELRDPAYLFKLWLDPLDTHISRSLSYRPMLIFSMMGNFLLTGESPVWFRVLNVALNGLVTFLVFLLIYELFSDQLLAGVSAIIFAFLPIHSEAVAQIKSRDELLATVFILISWLLWQKATNYRYIKIRKRLLFYSSMAFLLGVLSKEFMIVAPVIFGVVDWVRGKLKLVEIVRTGVIFIPAVVVYLIMRWIALDDAFSGPREIAFIKNPLFYSDWGVRLGTGLKTVFVYLAKTFIPYNLSASYGFDHFKLVTGWKNSGEAIGGLMILLLLIWVIFKPKLRIFPGVVGLFIFAIPALMASNLVVLVTDLFAERWAYFPSIGLSLVAGWVVVWIIRRWGKVVWLGLILILAIYGSILVRRNLVWAINERFYKQVSVDAPESVHARLMTAQYYAGRGEFQAARPHIQKGLEINRYPVLVELAAIAAFNDGDYEQAKKLAVEAIKGLDPKVPNRGHLMYATILAHEGEYQQSLNLVNWILANAKEVERVETAGGLPEFTFRESNPAIRFILAVDYYKLGQTQLAKKYFDWDTNHTEVEKIDMINKF